MADKVTHQSLIREARREIRALKPGRGIRRDAWFYVQELLLALAGYLPDVWPSERTLGERLDRPRPSIHRSLCLAREWGLVTTEPRAMEYGWRPGQTYHLTCLSEDLQAAIARHRFQASLRAVSKSSSSKKTNVTPPSEGFLSSAQSALDQTTQEAAVARRDPNADDFSSPAIGRDPDDLGPSLVVPPVDPAIRLAQVFDDRWADAKRRSPDLRTIRASSRGMAIGYLRNILIPENGPEHAEAYIVGFTQAAVDGDVEFRDGQFAFERFTAWWGREEIEDPVARAREREQNARIIAEYRRLTGG